MIKKQNVFLDGTVLCTATDNKYLSYWFLPRFCTISQCHNIFVWHDRSDKFSLIRQNVNQMKMVHQDIVLINKSVPIRFSTIWIR